MLKIYFDSKRLEPPKSETFWAYRKINPSERPEYTRYIQTRKELVTETTLEDADFVFIPYKWNADQNFNTSLLYNEAKNAQKKIVAFFNDDEENYVHTPNENFYLFRTSTKTIKQNEIVMPAFSEEFEFKIPLDEAINKQTISFCGNIQDPHRYSVFLEIQNQKNLSKNFIYRNGFWAPEIADKQLAKQQFISNMLDGLFGICIRGKGNFSYRLYETLALGRIPIIINTDLRLPLVKSIDWNKHAIIVEKNEISEIKTRISTFLNNTDPVEICRSNKQLYDEYLSPCGLLKHFHLYLQESDV